MPFKKGDPNAGRPKGSPNKETKKIRDWIGKFLEKNIEQFEEDVNSLTPKDRTKVITDLMEYSVPKLQRTEHVSDENTGFTINVITHSEKKSEEKS